MELLGVVVGAVIAALAGFGTQFWSERRTVAREAREREEARRVWARDHKRVAHAAFLAEYRSLTQGLFEHEMDFAPDPAPAPPEEFILPLIRLETDLELFCSEASVNAARELRDTFEASAGSSKVTYEQVRAAELAYLTSVRDDLGLSIDG